jgi:hypothetical protein
MNFLFPVSVLIIGFCEDANRISFEQWKNKKFPGSVTKEKKLSNLHTTDVQFHSFLVP